MKDITKCCGRCKEQRPIEHYRVINSLGTRRRICNDCYNAKRREAYRKDSTVRKGYKDSQTKRRRGIYKWLDDFKRTQQCKLCSENHPACMDFHHRDPSIKQGNITELVRRGCSRETILKEITKCDVLCANCHRKFHYKEKKT